MLTPNCRTVRALLVAFFALIVSVAAQTLPDTLENPATDAIRNVRDAITVHTTIAGIVAIIAGLILLFAGHRLFYPTLFLGGFYVFGSLAYVILINLEPDAGYNNRDTILLAVTLAVGFVGGLLSVCLVKLGIACVGAAGGFALAMFVLSWKTGGVIDSGIGKLIFILAMIVLGIVLVFFLLKTALIVATSIVGAYSLIFGIDMFARTGFTETVHNILVKRTTRVNEVTDTKVIALLVSFVVLAIIGMLVQFRTNRNRQFMPVKRV
ncbi:hypothetical protein PhCBS80983_g03890 [Powellomyces hirtus]|uniref:Transmembrane protein 198 n=1 Tax=Powellomyces hirtus TaxID=109895 RepID=A0A507E0A9_9FUNG|nr:hypothetical protein PhCBS80983_g03890 [Powellomyces hirtus]